MATGIYILVSVSVAAFVGGLTNHFAIKMLFHPRKELYLGKWRIPFTPGLIPKRKDEIAQSLGDVVANYLVTPQGMKQFLLHDSFQKKIEVKLLELITNLSQDQRTLKEVALTLYSEQQWFEVKQKVTHVLSQWINNGVTWVWEHYEFEQKSIKSFIPHWSEELKSEWAGRGACEIVSVLSESLVSIQGQQLLHQISRNLMSQSGGLFRTMAALFIDEDKIVKQITPVLLTQLKSKSFTDFLEKMLNQQIDKLGQVSLGKLMHCITEEMAKSWISQRLISLLSRSEEIENLKVSDIVASFSVGLINSVPHLTKQAVTFLQRHLEAIFSAIDLTKLVQTQVSQFPVEQLESIILSVSGREFRAITWLGAVLGGLIGLIQSTIVLFLG